jgi:hypothetical protein
LLRSRPEYEEISLVGNMATFRKVSHAQFLPDSSAEPFITANSTNARLWG